MHFLRGLKTFLKKTLGYLRHHPFWTIFTALVFFIFLAWLVSLNAEAKYQEQLSVVIYDRNNSPLSIKENIRGHYVLEAIEIPKEFEALLIKKEDRFFRYHPGVNPFSTVRALFSYITNGTAGGASTITQQLAKNLLGTESERTIVNKIIEALYAISLELFNTKEEILLMYANTVFLGNQTQGFETASHAYFDKPLGETTASERLSLLATLSHPSTRNPWQEENAEFAAALNQRLAPDQPFAPPTATTKYAFQTDSYFELRTAGIVCPTTCHTTIDDKVTADLRDILDRHIDKGWIRNIKNGAVVVIDPHNSEVLAMVGSRDPQSQTNGNQINLALSPRPIGSTIKPFIYAKGFAEGLRPYSLVEDREYKYPIATGFSLYPKNYDGQYRGQVTLHEALSNSLNVPSVKVLEYIGLENFYYFLGEDMAFQPIQDFDSYQYGIALGGLEMDLTTLTHYFTLFPNQGELSPLRILSGSAENFQLPPQSDITTTKQVVAPEYIALVHTIISDRLTGVNQFGLKGNLNLTTSDYGVKTGTSRDFHDSWVVGYTPDLVVGVWLGNSENQALDQVSGSSGAGSVWHDVMEYLLASDYHQEKSIDLSEYLERFPIDVSDEWGLKGDVIAEHQDLLLKDTLILGPHEGDTFELTENMIIPLKARTPVQWLVNGQDYGIESETNFQPTEAGGYEISAYDEERGVREIISVRVTLPE